MKKALIEKITNRQAQVGIVGLGYVGLPLAVAFAEAGFRVIGVDKDEKKVEALNRCSSYIEDVPDSQLTPIVKGGFLVASSEYRALVDVDAISICVPTPLRKTGDPDISFIIDAVDNIVGLGVTVVLSSWRARLIQEQQKRLYCLDW